MARNTDPNKYSKNKDIKPDSLFSNIVAIVRFGLLLMGIIGLSMEVFKDDGWLRTAFNKLFASSSSLMLIPVIVIALWLLNRWMTSPNKSETSKRGELPMYAMMAVGAYYAFNLLTTGSF